MKRLCNSIVFAILAVCMIWGVEPKQAEAVEVSGIHAGVQVAKDPELELRSSKVRLKKGSSKALDADIIKDKKDDNKYQVEWESTNEKVATVSAKGKIKAKKTGTCTITASIAGTDVETTCKVTVEPSITKGNKIKYGAAHDKKITASDLKKKVDSDEVVYDNAGNGYKRGKCLGKFVITGYCTRCNSGSSRGTSSGKKATAGVTVAVKSSQIPLGTKLVIGNHVYIAQDRHGNRSHSKVIDVFFGTRHGAEPFLRNIPVYLAK